MEPMSGFVTMGGGRSRDDAIRPPDYAFPLLKSSDILKCMEEANIPLTEDELKEPARHRDRLKEVWHDVLYSLTGQSEEDLRLPVLPEDASEDHKVMLANTSDTFLFRALNQLMTKAGYKDFSMRDLYAPKSKTLKCQFSAIINMLMYRENQLGFFEEVSEPRKELIQALGEVHEENKALNEQFNETQAASRQKNAELDEIIQECHELELEIAKDNRRQASTREEAAKLQREEKDLKDEITAAEWKFEELETKEENLRAKLVSSPDRRRTEMEDVRHCVLTEKKENTLLEEKIQKGKGGIRNLQKAEKDLKTTTTQLEDLHQSANKYMALMRSVEETNANIDEEEKLAKELEQETEEAERRVHRSEEKILAQRKQHSLELQANQEAHDKAKSRLLVVEKQRREDMLRAQQAEAEEIYLRAAFDAEQANGEKEIQEMLGVYKKAEEAFLERDRLRLAAVGIDATSSQ